MKSLGEGRFAVDMDLHDILVCIAYVQNACTEVIR